MSSGNQKEFRKDINALRAIAVALVVLYHFGVPGFSGGYIGVDVFFVISGYLMTRIIINRGGQPYFIFHFYLARARRIVPAFYLHQTLFTQKSLVILMLQLIESGCFIRGPYLLNGSSISFCLYVFLLLTGWDLVAMCNPESS